MTKNKNKKSQAYVELKISNKHFHLLLKNTVMEKKYRQILAKCMQKSQESPDHGQPRAGAK